MPDTTASNMSLDEKEGDHKKESDSQMVDDVAVASLDENKGECLVTLISDSGETIEIAKKIAITSELLKTMIDGDPSATSFPLSVTTGCLKQVVEFMTHHYTVKMNNIPKPLPTANLYEIVSEWDVNFVSKDVNVISELITAANYMVLDNMLDLCCAKFASLIKGKTPEEIRRTFNITNDFTPEEEAQVIRETAWARGDNS